MSDLSTAAHWLRQRDGEPDEAWIQRLDDFFDGVRRERQGLPPTITATERAMDRARKLYQASTTKAPS